MEKQETKLEDTTIERIEEIESTKEKLNKEITELTTDWFARNFDLTIGDWINCRNYRGFVWYFSLSETSCMVALRNIDGIDKENDIIQTRLDFDPRKDSFEKLETLTEEELEELQELNDEDQNDYYEYDSRKVIDAMKLRREHLLEKCDHDLPYVAFRDWRQCGKCNALFNRKGV